MVWRDVEMTAVIEAGTVEYTGRAFHQDAMEAMGGDIVRGLIETITNSDDAYAALETGRVGKITVEVEHRRNQSWRVITRDRATGMSADVMIERITRLGGRTSGFEAGEDRRGNLGRGAKDLAAFGDVTFASICDGHYAELALLFSGEWELRARRRATSEDREALGILRGNGTAVRIDVRSGVRCPQHDNLKRRLATHYQLRDILSDPQRRVELVNLNDGSSQPLTSRYPDIPEVFNGVLEIEGYPGVSAELVIRRHPTRYDAGPNDSGRPNGILIKGRRAIYENTLFRFESDVHAGWFTGRVVCPHIDQLAREYDDRLGRGEEPDPMNPVPIISRRRDGLNPAHPFTAGLRAAVETPLGELVAEESARARRELGNIESSDTREALDRLERLLSRLLTEELRDIEAEELPDYGVGDAPLLEIVPEQAFLYMGEDRTLSVVARAGDIALGDIVEIDSDPAGVVEVLSPSVALRSHTRREDVLVGQIRLRPLIEGESTIITGRLGEREAAALVEVKAPRDDDDPVIELPETLTFERPSYRIGWHRRKRIVLLAPDEVVEAEGPRVRIDSSDPGIVVRTPGAELVRDDEVGFFRADVDVEARLLNATGVITAHLGSLNATAHVAVTRREEGISYRIKLVDEEYGGYRAIVEEEPDERGEPTKYIKIAGRHPALRPYLGDDFGGQNTPIGRSVIAEVVADVTSRLVVTELYRLRGGTEGFDVDRFYREHYKRLLRFLPRFQRIMVGDPGVALSGAMLEPLPLLETAAR
jgi:hypothetical protein